MSLLNKTPVMPPPGEAENALVLHSSAFRVSQSPRPAGPPPSSGFEVDIIDSVERHWLLALCAAALILVGGIFYASLTMHPIYSAETTIYVPPDLAKDSTGSSSDNTYPTFVNQQVMSILNFDTLSGTLQRLNKKGVPWRLRGESERAAVDRLRGALTVQRIPDSFEIGVQMQHGDPRAAATIANAVAETFLDESRSDASGHSDRTSALLFEKATLEKELQIQLDIRAKLAESLQVVNLHKTTSLPDDEVLVQMREALASARNKRVEAEAQLAAGQTTVTAEAEQIASTDPAASSLTSSLLQKQFELRERIKTMLPTHPVRKQAEAELAVIEAELQKGPAASVPKVKERLMAKMRAQAEQSRRIEADLTQAIAQEALNIPTLERDLGKSEVVNGEITRIQDRMSRVESQIEEIRLRDSSGSTMRVFSAALPATFPAKSQRNKAFGIVFALALLLGLSLPVAIDLFDSRIYDPATIERLLGFPIVGMTIERTARTEQFADEHLCRLVAGIERGIGEGARVVLLTGLKQPVAPAIMRDISRELSGHKINVTVRPGRRRFDTEMRLPNGKTRLIGPGAALTDDLENCDVTLMDAPALVFSAEAERLAAEADMTLVVVQAGSNTRDDLVRGARLLERLNVPAVGVILQDVRVKRAGRALRRDLREYLAMQRQQTELAGRWDGTAIV